MMAQKRTSQDEGQGNDARNLQVPGKRRRGDTEPEETRQLSFHTGSGRNAMEEIAFYLQPVLQKVMKEMIQETIPRMLQEMIPPMLQQHVSPCCCARTLNQKAGTSGGRALQLCFVNQLPETIYTQSDITAEGEGGVQLQIELRDAVTHQRIVKDQGYSMSVEICVLDGDFGSEDWTAEEFNAQTSKPRKGKRPLLVGNTVIALKNGVGYITKKIMFTDNSSGTSTGTFRLGVKIVQSNSTRADIREGRSEPFKVLDYRGKHTRKYKRPSLNDEVWRLKNIAKIGERYKQLSEHGIKTVKDLLRLYTTDQASLREKIGKIADNPWNAIIAHAKECHIDDDERYLYYATEQAMHLVLNCVYEVVEVFTFDGQNFHPVLSSLNSEGKRWVERAAKHAYNNLKDLMPFETTKHGPVEPLAVVQTAQHGGPDRGPLRLDFPIAQQGQLESQSYASTSQSELVGSAQLAALEETLPHCSSGGQLISGGDTDDGNSWSFGEPHIAHFNYWEPECLLSYPDYGDLAQSCNTQSLSNFVVNMPSRGERKQIWQLIRNAFRVFSFFNFKK